MDRQILPSAQTGAAYQNALLSVLRYWYGPSPDPDPFNPSLTYKVLLAMAHYDLHYQHHHPILLFPVT